LDWEAESTNYKIAKLITFSLTFFVLIQQILLLDLLLHSIYF